MRRLKLNGTNLNVNGALALDASAYVNITSVDTSKNKVFKFNLWLDGSILSPVGGAAEIFYLRSSATGGDNDDIAIWHVFTGGAEGKLQIATSASEISLRSSGSLTLTPDLYNKHLRCELRKAERHLHYFKINDVSIVFTNQSGVLSGGGSYIGLNAINCVLWDMELYDYDSSLFNTTPTLINKWKGYPAGNTNAAWQDLAGSNNGTLVVTGTYASTRNLTGGASSSSANRLKLNSNGPISVADFYGYDNMSLNNGPLSTLELTNSYETILQFKLWLDNDTNYNNQGFTLDTSQNLTFGSMLGMMLHDSSIFFAQGQGYKDYSISGKKNQVLNCEIFKNYADTSISYFKINGVAQTPGKLFLGTSGRVNAVIIGSGAFRFPDFNPTDLSTLSNATIWDVKMIEASTGTLLHYWKGYPNGNLSSAWVDQVGSVDGLSTMSRERLINNGLSNNGILKFNNNQFNWFLPSRDELNLMYTNLHLEGVGNFQNNLYWSSSEPSVGVFFYYLYGIYQNFNTGEITTSGKNASLLTRPCRKFSESGYSFALKDRGPANGWIFYQGGGFYYEAAPSDTINGVWSNVTDASVGTSTDIGSGLANTNVIISQVGHTTSAALNAKNFSG